MADYLFIESRDPFADRTLSEHLELMGDLAGKANKVELYLVQDAVLLGKKAVSNAALDALVARGVIVHADDFSLLQRGISGDEMKQVCTVSPISHVVEAMENNFKVIWN